MYATDIRKCIYVILSFIWVIPQVFHLLILFSVFHFTFRLFALSTSSYFPTVLIYITLMADLIYVLPICFLLSQCYFYLILLNCFFCLFMSFSMLRCDGRYRFFQLLFLLLFIEFPSLSIKSIIHCIPYQLHRVFHCYCIIVHCLFFCVLLVIGMINVVKMF